MFIVTNVHNASVVEMGFVVGANNTGKLVQAGVWMYKRMSVILQNTVGRITVASTDRALATASTDYLSGLHGVRKRLGDSIGDWR